MARPRCSTLTSLVLVVVIAAGACSGEAPGPGPEEGSTGSGPPPPEVTPPEEIEVEPEPDPEPGPVVVVNGVGLDGGTLAALESELGWAVAEGSYWYDPVLGAVGVAGGPMAGFLPAGLVIGGPLAPDASAGATGVFLNGRELPDADLAALEQLFAAPFPPDRYVLDAAGNYGYEGEPPLGNLFADFQQSSPPADPGVDPGIDPGPGTVTETAGGWIGGEGDDGYYFDPDSGCSVMSDGVSC